MSIYMINSFIYIIKAPIAIVISPKVSGITPLSNNKTCNSLQEKQINIKYQSRSPFFTYSTFSAGITTKLDWVQ